MPARAATTASTVAGAALDRRRAAGRSRGARVGGPTLRRPSATPGPSSRSSTSWASRTTAAPSASSWFVPDGAPRGHRPGHRADLAAGLDRHLGGDQRARPLGGLDDDGDPAERRHQPVARREHPAERRRRRAAARRRTRPRCPDPLVEAVPGARIGALGPGAEHRDGRPPPAASAPSCAAESTPSASPLITVDARCRRAAVASCRGDLAPVGAGAPRADDRRPRAPASSRASSARSPAPNSARGARGAERAERRREAGVVRADAPAAGARRALARAPARRSGEPRRQQRRGQSFGQTASASSSSLSASRSRARSPTRPSTERSMCPASVARAAGRARRTRGRRSSVAARLRSASAASTCSLADLLEPARGRRSCARP